MKIIVTISVVLLIVIVAVVLFFRSYISTAESGLKSELPGRLTKLKADTSPTAFLGFCTRDADALYFVYLDNVFYLDYELTTLEKKSCEQSFRKTAADLGFAVIDTTYGDYPVLRIKIDPSETQAAKVGCEFAKRMFGQNDQTVVEFLP